VAWLANTTQLTFELESSASLSVGIRGVAWIISNSQDDADAMVADHYSGSRLGNNDDTEEIAWNETVTAVPALTRASIWGETARSSGTNTAIPRGAIDLQLTAVNTVQLRQADAQETRTYRYSVVAWPDDN